MFKTNLVVEQITDRQWRVHDPLIWNDDDTGETVEVPAGTITDFASVPRLPFVYWLFGGIANRPAVLHDYCYQTHCRSKPAADWILLKAMKDEGISAWRRYPIYAGVVVFGWVVYANYKRRVISLGNA